MGSERPLTYFAGLDRKRSRSLRLIEMLLETPRIKVGFHNLEEVGMAEQVDFARTATLRGSV